ncbi:MAG: MscS family membrane protein [Chlamydiales bacterium]|jgi:MscS family membrane protein
MRTVIATTRVAWLLIVLSLVAAPGRAQETVDAPAVPETPRFDSPRAVQRAFFEAMQKGDGRRATETFPDRAFGSQSEAEVAAHRLYEDVFLRTRRISVEKEFGSADLEGISLFKFETWPADDVDNIIELVFERVSDGGWRFGERTLRSISAWASQLASVGLSDEVLEGFSTMERIRYRIRSGLPEALTAHVFLVENWQWAGLLMLALVAAVADRVARFLAALVATRLTRGEGVRLNKDVLLSFQRPAGMFAAVGVFEFLLPIIGIDAGVLSVLRLATSAIAAVAGVWAFYRLVDVLCDYLAVKAARSASKFDDMLVPLLRRTLKIFVVVIGMVFVASRMSEDLWGIVAGLSLGSLAIGFAAKDSVENLFGTFTVLMDKPFQIGDWIVSGDMEGTVEAVGFRSTRIRTFYNSVITVPNREFIGSPVDNMGKRRYRRIRTTLGLTYDTPPEKIEAFCEGVREIIRQHPYTRKDYYHVYLNGMGASSLEVLLYTFVETPDWSTELREKHRLFADILRLAEQLGVGFAFPTQTLHMARPEDLEHPDRPASDEAGATHGRDLAAEIVGQSLAASGGRGSVPAPVEIQTLSTFKDGGE